MVSILIILILSGLYCFLFNFIPLSPWFNFLWAILSIILAILSYLLFVIIFVEANKKTKPTGKFRYKLARDVVRIIFMITNTKVDYVGKENVRVIRTSTKDNTGIDILEDTIKELFFRGDIKINDEVVITNLRHKEALQDAYESLCQVIRSLEDEMPEDFYSIDLMSAYASLGKIIGEEVGEDLVNEIFSKFCMGK